MASLVGQEGGHFCAVTMEISAPVSNRALRCSFIYPLEGSADTISLWPIGMVNIARSPVDPKPCSPLAVRDAGVRPADKLGTDMSWAILLPACM